MTAHHHDTPLSVEAARQHILADARSPGPAETLPLDQALGRILAEELISPVNVPPLDNSAMDGYALRLADWQGDHWLTIGQRIPAGKLGQPLAPGEAARIFTGAPIPAGADAVVMQEECQVHEGRVRIQRPPREGENIRRAGEDIALGQPVLTAGTRLGPAQLGVAASIGRDRALVHPRLKVAVFFTGDELVMPGQPLQPGQIYNSNRAALSALVRQLGCDLIDLGQVPDSLDATLAALEQASAVADVVITSGGVSVGEEDHVKSAVERLGRIQMWKVAMKPGKPLVYGRVANADFLGLPGNPVSAFVVFCLFVRPFLLKRMGANLSPMAAITLPAGFQRTKPGKRREFMRARIEDGRVVLFPNQSSGVLTSLAWAQGLVDVDAGTTVQPQDPVAYLPLSELLT